MIVCPACGQEKRGVQLLGPVKLFIYEELKRAGERGLSRDTLLSRITELKGRPCSRNNLSVHILGMREAGVRIESFNASSFVGDCCSYRLLGTFE